MDRQNFQDLYSSTYHRVNWTYGSPNRDLIFQALWYVTIWTAFPLLPHLEGAGLYSQGPWQKGSTFPASGLMERLQPSSRFLSPREEPQLLVVMPPEHPLVRHRSAGCPSGCTQAVMKPSQKESRKTSVSA